MLDISNYTPPSGKCKDCQFYMREGNYYTNKVVLRCLKKPFYVGGYKSYHTTKANNPACKLFKKAEDLEPKIK